MIFHHVDVLLLLKIETSTAEISVVVRHHRRAEALPRTLMVTLIGVDLRLGDLHRTIEEVVVVDPHLEDMVIDEEVEDHHLHDVDLIKAILSSSRTKKN